MKNIGSASNMKKLNWLVDFLEEDLTVKSLESNPQITLELGRGIRDIFLSKDTTRFWNKNFFSRKKNERL